ncbi:MAG: thiolase family protein [Ideonella sp.]|nr:thiolase family protein [Ideonella sp.]MCC7458973.1 thiolase family protein [Nitrospira sp.]
MSANESPIYIAGVGMTEFGRHESSSVKQLTARAVGDAIADAGCTIDTIDAAFFGSAAQSYLHGQLLIGGQVALLPLGLQGIPIYNVENACATGSTAFHLGVDLLRSGEAEVALVVGVDKMFSRDKSRVFDFFAGGWDVESSAANARCVLSLGAGLELPIGSEPKGPHSLFMDVYASYARAYMLNFGLTQRQLAVIAAKNHAHAVHNPRAQYREACTIEQVLGARPISYPLTLPMCAPVSDGAAAAVLCTGGALRRLGLDRRRSIRVLASVMRSGAARGADEPLQHVCRLAALQAYERAGLGPEDMDVAEVHDASAMGELLQTEHLGFCPLGGGGMLAESGATAIGGRIPVNPSGGLESKGHPIGATGLAQLYELAMQLRGECSARQVDGARIAVQENGGGLWGIEEASVHVGILAREG